MRIEEWKLVSSGWKERSRTISIIVKDSIKSYHSQNTVVGLKRALTFRFKYMMKLLKNYRDVGIESLY